MSVEGLVSAKYSARWKSSKSGRPYRADFSASETMVRCSSRARTGESISQLEIEWRSQTFHKIGQKRKVRTLALNKQRARKRAIPAVPTIVKRKVPRRPNSE